MKRTVLITGGAGFVGSNLSILFKTRGDGYDVIALDNLKRRGSELNLPRLREAGVAFVHGDIRCHEDIPLAGKRPDTIIECSAEPSVLAGVTSSARYLINTNLAGTVNCLEAARAWGSDVIFLSTSRVYPVEKLNALKYDEGATRFSLTDGQAIAGASSEGITLDFPLDGYRSLYGATKLSSEHLLEEYGAMYGLRSVVNRCGVIAGPWQMGKVDQGVFVHWMGSHYFRKDLCYFGYGGKGFQVRDLLHIEDLFELIRWQAENIGMVAARKFNVGGGRRTSLSLYESTLICGEITGNSVKVSPVQKDRELDVRIYMTDLTEVEKITGWSPKRSSRDILVDIYDWIRSNEGQIKQVLFN